MTCQSPPSRVFTFALCLTAALSTLLFCIVLAPTPALALTNPERHYEMVSPIYKAGYGVAETMAVSPDGDSVAFTATGGFDGTLAGSAIASNLYVAQRGSSGWSTVAVQPPVGTTVDFSANLEYALANAPLGPNILSVNNKSTEDEFQLRRVDAPNTAASWEVFGGITMKLLNEEPFSIAEDGASPELCHIVTEGEAGPLVQEARNAGYQIYDLSRGCGGESPSLRLIGVKNRVGVHEEPEVINRACKVELGVDLYAGSGTGQEQVASFNAIATGGREIFFTTNPERTVSGGPGCGAKAQLFVRLDGLKTLEISRPLEASKQFGGCVAGGVPGEVPCEGSGQRASAFFKGASEDGTRVFFTTTQALTGEDKDAGNDLYMATIGCPSSEPGCEVAKREVTSLTQVSHDATVGEAAEVQGVVRLAPDGSRAYFVARGVLGEGVNAQGGAPTKGADNLYVYDTETNGTSYVADLCSGPALSGEVEDAHCPTDLEASNSAGSRSDSPLWSSPIVEAQTAGPDGKFLVFATYAQLLPDDIDNAKDIYRYNAETGALERVSVGEAGADANGNCDEGTTSTICDATIASGHVGGGANVVLQQEMSTRAISEDGSRIVFTSAEPLSADANNGLVNVYEWHEGSVSLIGGEAETYGTLDTVISASGQDIFFKTHQGLVPQDTDGLYDIYDARLGSGFAPPPAPREPCSGDACQGSLTNPAPLLVPGSVSQTPGGNFAAPVSPTTVKPKPKSKPVKCHNGYVKKKVKCVRQPKAKRSGKGRKQNV